MYYVEIGYSGKCGIAAGGVWHYSRSPESNTSSALDNFNIGGYAVVHIAIGTAYIDTQKHTLIRIYISFYIFQHLVATFDVLRDSVPNVRLCGGVLDAPSSLSHRSQST